MKKPIISLVEEQKVQGSLEGIDGNALSLVAHFQRLGRRQGVDASFIKQVTADALSGDYHRLVTVLSNAMRP